MRKYLVSSILFTLCSCQKEDSIDFAAKQDSYWKRSHSAMMEIKGDVSSVYEYYVEEESLKFLSSTITFDDNGNISAYNSNPAMNKRSTYWIPQSADNYIYKYDASGRLSAIEIYLSDQLTERYALCYGEHSKHVPLPFNLEPIGLYLVKGLTAVTSDTDPDFSFEFDGTCAFHEKSSWGQRTVSTFQFSDEYPETKTTLIYSAGSLISTEFTEYMFDSNGTLSQVKISEENDYGSSMITNSYDNEGRLTLKCVLNEDGTTNKKQFSYNSHGWLTQISGLTNGESVSLANSYYDIDGRNNWIRMEQNVKGFIDWSHPIGKNITEREIYYR